jgi:hypothetical protein
MDITTHSDWCVHFQQVGLCLQDLCALPDDPQSLLFRQASFAVEVLLQELDIGLGAILR